MHRFNTCHTMVHGGEPLLHDVIHGFHKDSMFASSSWTPSHGNQLSRLAFGLSPMQTVVFSPCMMRRIPGMMQHTFDAHLKKAFESMATSFMVGLVDTEPFYKSKRSKKKMIENEVEEGNVEGTSKNDNKLLFLLPSFVCLLQNMENLADAPERAIIREIVESNRVGDILKMRNKALLLSKRKRKDDKLTMGEMKNILEDLHTLLVQVYETVTVPVARKYYFEEEVRTMWDALQRQYEEDKHTVHGFVPFLSGMDAIVRFLNEGIAETRMKGMVQVVEVRRPEATQCLFCSAENMLFLQETSVAYARSMFLKRVCYEGLHSFRSKMRTQTRRAAQMVYDILQATPAMDVSAPSFLQCVQHNETLV